MVSHRLKEEVFFRIPLNAFGGFGKSLGIKPLKCTGADASNSERDSNRTTSVISAKDSEKIPAVSNLASMVNMETFVNHWPKEKS